MLPLIGTMIGAYIILQCIAHASRPNLSESNLTRVAAMICAFLIVCMLFALWTTAAQFDQVMAPLSK